MSEMSIESEQQISNVVHEAASDLDPARLERLAQYATALRAEQGAVK